MTSVSLRMSITFAQYGHSTLHTCFLPFNLTPPKSTGKFLFLCCPLGSRPFQSAHTKAARKRDNGLEQHERSNLAQPSKLFLRFLYRGSCCLKLAFSGFFSCYDFAVILFLLFLFDEPSFPALSFFWVKGQQMKMYVGGLAVRS
jgi:hypothetical protein